MSLLKSSKEKGAVIIKSVIHLVDDKGWCHQIHVDGDFGDALTYTLRTYKRTQLYPLSEDESYTSFDSIEHTDHIFRKYFENLERVALKYFCRHVHFDMNQG